MAIKIDEQYVKQVNSIMSKLPQNPFIVDVVGKAIEISYKNRDVNKDYSVVLELADKVAEYTTANSSTTSYKYALIAAILLAGVPSEEYEVIDTASGTVKDYVEAFTAFAFADGYKKTWLELNNLVKKDSDLLYLALLVMVNNIEVILKHENGEGPTTEDKYDLAGMAYIEVSLRKSAITIPNRQYDLYNKFMSLVMKKIDF